MKKIASLFICMILLCGIAAAEQNVSLPGGRYMLDLPDGMKYSAPEPEDYGMEAYTSDTLEMDFVSYQNFGMHSKFEWFKWLKDWRKEIEKPIVVKIL